MHKNIIYLTLLLLIISKDFSKIVIPKEVPILLELDGTGAKRKKKSKC